jgi:predicted N-acetyltransferase YhbS
MVTIRNERVSDIGAREALLDAAYGDVRFTKPSHKLREGRLPAAGLSLVATEHGRVIGSVRLWHVRAGASHDALLLGPLAVDPARRNRGIGAALMQRAIRLARMRGHGAVLLVGDVCYYGRFGFSAELTGKLALPGQPDAARLLALELKAGALMGARGEIEAAGVPEIERVQKVVATRRSRGSLSRAA